MGEEKIKKELLDLYSKWRVSEKSFFEKLKLNHDFKKLEKEQIKLITKKFSEFAKIDTPLTEKEILELEEYYLFKEMFFMSDNKLKEDLVKVYKEWKDLEKKAGKKIKHHHELKKEEKEDEIQRFSDYAGLSVPITEEMLLYLDEEYFRV